MWLEMRKFSDTIVNFNLDWLEWEATVATRETADSGMRRERGSKGVVWSDVLHCIVQ